MFLEREPPVLFLVLRRDHRHVDGRESKDTRPVVFPETLEWLRSGQYRFAAVIRHSGTGLRSGHYTSHILLGESHAGAFVYAHCNDDATVSMQSWAQLAVRQVQREAYILVYHRAQSYQHAHGDGTHCTPYRRERQSEVVCSQGVPARSGTAASSSRQSQPEPSASSSRSSRDAVPMQISMTPTTSSAASVSASGSSSRARAPHPRRALRRSYTMYPADGSAGDLPAPRMVPALPPWVSSLGAAHHMLLEPAATASSSQAPERPDADLVFPVDLAQGDSNITRQLASMRLAPQGGEGASPQCRSRPPPVAERARTMPRATRLPGFSRPRTRASTAKEQAGREPGEGSLP